MNRFSRSLAAAVLGGSTIALSACISTTSSDETTTAETTAPDNASTTEETSADTTAAPDPTTTSPTETTTAATDPVASTTVADSSPSGDTSVAAAFVQSSVDATLNADSFNVDAQTSLEIQEQTVYLTVTGYKSPDLADVEIYVDNNGQESTVRAKSDGVNVWVQNEDSGENWLESDMSVIPEGGLPANGLIGPVIMLRGVEDVTVGDTSELDGTTVTEYTATVSYVDAVSAAGELEEDFTSALSLTGAAEIADLNIVVLIGEDNIVRNLDFEVDNPFVTGGGSVILTDVNLPVPSPEPPPADLIVPAN